MDINLQPGQRVTVSGPPLSDSWQTLPGKTLARGESVTVRGANVRTIKPGEDISLIASLKSDPLLLLEAGNHKPFVLTDSSVDITFAPGAMVDGKGTARAIEIIRGAPVLRNAEAFNAGNGIRLFGTTQAMILGGKVHHNIHMIRNDTKANNDFGAMGFAFDDVVGPVTVRGVDVFSNRVNKAAQSIDYKLAEGSAFELWRSKGITIEECRTWDNQVNVETGTNDAAKPCGLLLRNNRMWNGETDSTRDTKGILWRSGTGLIEHNVFDRLDHWCINPAGGGNFGATIDLTVRDNLAFTPAAFIQTGAYVGKLSHDYNAVAGTKVWGTGGTEAHGLAVTDAKLDADYRPLTGSPLIGKGHDGSVIGFAE